MMTLKEYQFLKPKAVYVDHDSIYVLDEEKGIAVFSYYAEDLEGWHEEPQVICQEEQFDKLNEDKQIHIKAQLGIISEEQYGEFRKKRIAYRQKLSDDRDREKYEKLKKKFESK